MSARRRPELVATVAAVLAAHVAAWAVLAPPATEAPSRPAHDLVVSLVPADTGPSAPPATRPAHAEAPTDAGSRGRTPSSPYLPASALERQPLPRSAPDVARIQGLPWSGFPTRLRLYVDADGRVVRVRVLRSHEAAEVLARLCRMWRATAFVPGHLAGRDVASYLDIEMNVGLQPAA